MGARPLDKALLRRVMDLLATGVSPPEAARQTGVSTSKVYLMHHSVGGVYRPPRQRRIRSDTSTGTSVTSWPGCAKRATRFAMLHGRLGVRRRP